MKAGTVLSGFIGSLALSALVIAAIPDARAEQPGEVQSMLDAQFAQTTSYIIQSTSLLGAQAAVERVHGNITHELAIIDAVAAQLSLAQVAALQADPGLVLTPNASVTVAGSNGHVQPYVVQHTQANLLHSSGITGKGITIAFLDTGWYRQQATQNNTAGQNVVLQGYDAIGDMAGVGAPDDQSGHGTHVLSIATNSAISEDGTYIGMAPDAARVIIRAFDQNGSGTYADAIRGMSWILDNAGIYHIRVVNMSFSARPQSYYWNDPIDQAVMKLWRAGIVVVAAAGNSGPAAQSITVPGNVPYVITVGAMLETDRLPNPASDRLDSFSSTGPTAEGFVKPDIVAPGGHVMGVMSLSSTIVAEHPSLLVATDYAGSPYVSMSGTSMSTAVVTGAVALMLQAEPDLTPDQVKCKLISSAQPATDASGNLAYSVFQQGAGEINAYNAVFSPNTDCGNVGLNIDADLARTQHFSGPARQSAAGEFYIVDQSGKPISAQGYLWNNSTSMKAQGYLWNNSDSVKAQGYLWNNSNSMKAQGYLWNNSNSMKAQGYLWNNSTSMKAQGYLWNNSTSMKAQGYLWNNSTSMKAQGYLWNNATGVTQAR